jgi:hypothetical protein
VILRDRLRVSKEEVEQCLDVKPQQGDKDGDEYQNTPYGTGGHVSEIHPASPIGFAMMGQ